MEHQRTLDTKLDANIRRQTWQRSVASNNCYPAIGGTFIKNFVVDNTAWKESLFGVFLVRFFPHWTECREILRIYPYSVRIKTPNKNSEYGHFSRSAIITKKKWFRELWFEEAYLGPCQASTLHKMWCFARFGTIRAI